MERWRSFASDEDAVYDDVVTSKREDIAPSVTWGISPDHGVPITGSIPVRRDARRGRARQSRRKRSTT